MFTVIRQHLEAVVHELDPEVMAPADAVAVLEEVEKIERLAGAAKTLLAPRATESGQWQRDGHVSPEEWFANKTGTTIGEAKDTIETGKKVKKQPKVKRALRKGKLSRKQASAVADAAAADPAATDSLLSTAERESLKVLRDQAERVKAAARAESAEAEHERLHRQRSLYTRKDRDGAAVLTARGTPAAMAEIKSHLEPFIRAAFERARLEDRREPAEAYAFDGLVAMAQASAGGSGDGEVKTPAKVFVRVDYAAFCRGMVEGDELCEIDGVGPVPVSVAREFAEDAFVVGLLTKGIEVSKLNHFGRAPNAVQQSLIEWKAKWCQVLGCTRTKIERDHGAGWANTHETRADDLWGFCDPHHDLKTYKGYRIVECDVPGRVLLVPPDDPDPPRRE